MNGSGRTPIRPPAIERSPAGAPHILSNAVGRQTAIHHWPYPPIEAICRSQISTRPSLSGSPIRHRLETAASKIRIDPISDKSQGILRRNPYPAGYRPIRRAKPANCGSGAPPDIDGPANRLDRSSLSIPTQHQQKTQRQRHGPRRTGKAPIQGFLGDLNNFIKKME
jgi:hypothetical protein